MLFKDRVLKTIRQHGEITTQPEGSAVNFLSCSHGHWKAFFVRAHGHLTRNRLHDLENYQFKTGITVIIVSEQADHVPRFEALRRHLKWRKRVNEKYKKKVYMH